MPSLERENDSCVQVVDSGDLAPGMFLRPGTDLGIEAL